MFGREETMTIPKFLQKSKENELKKIQFRNNIQYKVDLIQNSLNGLKNCTHSGEVKIGMLGAGALIAAATAVGCLYYGVDGNVFKCAGDLGKSIKVAAPFALFGAGYTAMRGLNSNK